MCMIPAAMGMFGGRAKAVARGGLLGGIPGAMIGAAMGGKKKRKDSPVAQPQPTPPITGASPSYGG